MLDLPADVLSRIDAVCDDFERAAITGQRPDPAHFLGAFQVEHQPHVLKWLLPVDMELRNKAVQHAKDWMKSVEDYVQQFPGLAESEANECLEAIVAAEFSLQQSLQGAPDIPRILTRFPHLALSIAPRLRRELFQLHNIYIRAASETDEELFFSLDRVIQVGRQRSTEPPPIRCVELDGVTSRVVIAPFDEVNVSRQHLTCQLVALGQVAVRNQSAKSSVVVGSNRVRCNETWIGRPPFTVHLGPRVFHVILT